MCILAKNVPKDSRNRLMPLAFGGIALGVLIGYPLGGAAYQLLGKTAPFMFIAFFILISIGKLLRRLWYIIYNFLLCRITTDILGNKH